MPEPEAQRPVAVTANEAHGPVRRVLYEVHAVARGVTPTHLHLRQRLVAVLVVSLIVDAIGTIVILFLERHAKGTMITNLGDSAFWVTTQLLTVSSQLPNPLSPGARVLDVFLQAYAITVVATLAGSFGAFFHRRGMERHPPDSATRTPARAS